MNRMADVAAMFDLELGERFRVRDKQSGQLIDWVYYFDESGLHWSELRSDFNSKTREARPNCENDVLTDVISTRDLDLLLRGEYEIVCERWKPSKGDDYYSIDSDGSVWCNTFDSDMDLLIWAFGDCFKTRDEANENVGEIVAKFHELIKEFKGNA